MTPTTKLSYFLYIYLIRPDHTEDRGLKVEERTAQTLCPLTPRNSLAIWTPEDDPLHS